MTESRKVEPLVRSDALPSFRRFLLDVPALQRMFGELIQIRLVIDANVVQKELRWRLRSRRDSNARSDLHEAIDSGTIIAFAPAALRGEIEEHIGEIALYAGVCVDRAREEWQAFQSCLHFYEPETSHQVDGEYVDPDDLPYKLACNQLGAQAVYTRDAHFQAMRVPAITVSLDLACRNYARATSIQVGIKLGTGFTVMVSLHVLTGIVQACVEGFRRLPNPVKLAIAVVVLIALLHPKCRENIAGLFRSIRSELNSAKSPLAATFTNLASQFIEAQKTASDASGKIKSLLPAKRKHPALVHARAVCLASKKPLSLAEIERQMRNEGYVSRSRNLIAYLRRVMGRDQRFVEVSPGKWAFQPDRLA